MSNPIEPPPSSAPIADQSRKLTWNWQGWINTILLPFLQRSPQVQQTVTLTNQSASIAATPFSLGTVSGRYRIHAYTQVTTPDGVSSSITVTLNWTKNSQALSASGAAVTGDSLTTEQNWTAFLSVDGGSPITYTVTYASDTQGKMHYLIELTVERVS